MPQPRSRTAARPTKLSKAVLAAIPRYRTSVYDDVPAAVRRVRLFVLDQHETICVMLDGCLADLILAFYPNRRKEDILDCAQQLTIQVERLAFMTKLNILRPSLESSARVDIRALEELGRLRNRFAHRSFDWETLKYRGKPLWRVRTLRRLGNDVIRLLNDVDEYQVSIMDAKRKARHKAPDLDMRAYWHPREQQDK